MRGREIIVWRTYRKPWPPLHPLWIPMLVHVDFEVFGDIRGCNFPQCAKDMGDRLGLRGWIRPSRFGNIIGQMQGEKDRVDEMAIWLRHQGSPGSRVDFCDFRNWQLIDSFDYYRFNVRF